MIAQKKSYRQVEIVGIKQKKEGIADLTACSEKYFPGCLCMIA
jgi:hypothetical protein